METGARLKELINEKGITAYMLSDDTGIPQSTISRIINKGTKPNASNLKVICEYFDISRQYFLTGVNDYGNIKELASINNVRETIDMQVSYLSAETSSIMSVPLVSQYAYGGYLSGFLDNEYLESLPKVPFILDKEYKGQYLCFEVKGDSMECDNKESIPEGSLLLCRDVKQDYWKSKLHINKWDFVIVTKTEGILVKRIADHNVDEGVIILRSLNDFYPDKKIHLKDVSQIFNIALVQGTRKRR